MLPLIAALAFFQTPDEPPRLRSVLDNGAIVLVEPMPKEPVISVQLFASAKHLQESEGTHGYRHLLEHLLARGDGSLDKKLETQSCFLEAKTLRDAMQIEITVGPSQLQLALDTLGGLLRKPDVTQERIDKELRVMRDELAMQDDPLLLSSAAWRAAYGDAGLDPMGTFDSMYHATPEKLLDTYERQFAGDGLVLTIAGPVGLDTASNSAKALLAPLSKGHFTAARLPRVGKAGRGESLGFGECRGAVVPGYHTTQVASALAAALAIASEVPGCFVTYTPSSQPGLVLIGRTDSNSGLGLYIDSLQSGAGLFARGKVMALEWVRRQLRSAEGVAYLRGLLLCQGEANKPEALVDLIDNLTPAQFEDGIHSFKSDRAVIAVGTR